MELPPLPSFVKATSFGSGGPHGLLLPDSATSHHDASVFGLRLLVEFVPLNKLHTFDLYGGSCGIELKRLHCLGSSNRLPAAISGMGIGFMSRVTFQQEKTRERSTVSSSRNTESECRNRLVPDGSGLVSPTCNTCGTSHRMNAGQVVACTDVLFFLLGLRFEVLDELLDRDFFQLGLHKLRPNGQTRHPN